MSEFFNSSLVDSDPLIGDAMANELRRQQTQIELNSRQTDLVIELLVQTQSTDGAAGANLGTGVAIFTTVIVVELNQRRRQ